MKIRIGFVSNSSSSSFICAVSGGIESGMDATHSDFEMSSCENGHEFYDEYLIGEIPENWEDLEDYEDDTNELPKKHCPICTMKNFNVEELLAYLIKTHVLTLEEIQDIIRSNMKTYDDYKGFIKDVKIR